MSLDTENTVVIVDDKLMDDEGELFALDLASGQSYHRDGGHYFLFDLDERYFLALGAVEREPRYIIYDHRLEIVGSFEEDPTAYLAGINMGDESSGDPIQVVWESVSD